MSELPHNTIDPTDATASRSHAWQATKAVAKASLGLLNPKLWLLSVMPLLLASLIWVGIAYLGWDSVNALVRGAIGGVDVPLWLPDWLPNRGVMAPFLVLLLAFPLVLVTALIGVSLWGTGVVAQRVAAQYGLAPLPRTALEKSGVWLANLWHSCWVMLVLVAVWLVTLPAWLLLGAGMLVALVLLGWANARLFSRDVLSDFATPAQRTQLLREHRATLWGLGLLASVPAAVPTMMWVSGALAFVALPVMALAAVWLSIMVFLASGLLFSHYLLPALKTLVHIETQNLAKQQAQITAEQAQRDAQAIETTVIEVPALPAV